MAITCTRRISFCSGHRVMKHEGLCGYPHGHNYVAIIVAGADHLDSLGRIIDFTVLKEKVGGWLNSHWDHNFLAFEEDQEMLAALNMLANSRQPFLCPFNPTAENMAHYLLTVVCPEVLADTGVKVISVIIEETPNCSAESNWD